MGKKLDIQLFPFFAERGVNVIVMDTRSEPPFAEMVKDQYPNVELILGGLNEQVLCAADKIILSPGLAIATKEIQAAIMLGVPVVGDIQIFCRIC